MAEWTKNKQTDRKPKQTKNPNQLYAIYKRLALTPAKWREEDISFKWDTNKLDSLQENG